LIDLPNVPYQPERMNYLLPLGRQLPDLEQICEHLGLLHGGELLRNPSLN
jgi:hypothetical protein